MRDSYTYPKAGRLIWSRVLPTNLFLISIPHTCWCSTTHWEASVRLWPGGVGDEFKFHLVNSLRFASQFIHGLCIRNVLLFNKALFRKWLWLYAFEREVLWQMLLEAKYESMWGRWCSNKVGVWKNMKRCWIAFFEGSFFCWEKHSSFEGSFSCLESCPRNIFTMDSLRKRHIYS